MAAPAVAAGKAVDESTNKRMRGAYRALLVFAFLYYARPEDVIPFLRVIPLGKITGGIALLALIVGLLSQRGRVRFPTEIKLLIALFGWEVLTIPFAYWRGGAFAMVMTSFSKAVIAAILVSMLVTSLDRLRPLLFIQASLMALVTIASLGVYRHQRMVGVLGGVFGNPNDLAINIALNWPLCLAFLLAARGPLKKGLWAIGILAMLWGVVATYSRSGFLAMALAATICIWEFGIRGRRIHLVLLAAVCVVGILLVVPSNYYARLESIFLGSQVENSMDRGSSEARKELLKISLRLMATHPLVGVGPGNFPAFSGSWRVAHNTYTELGCEAGIPALLLFLLVMRRAYLNLRAVHKSALYKENKEFRLFAGALFASFAAYVLGAFFADTSYNLFPYFLVAYTTALYQIAFPVGDKVSAKSEKNLESQGDQLRKRDGKELIWSR